MLGGRKRVGALCTVFSPVSLIPNMLALSSLILTIIRYMCYDLCIFYPRAVSQCIDCACMHCPSASVAPWDKCKSQSATTICAFHTLHSKFSIYTQFGLALHRENWCTLKPYFVASRFRSFHRYGYVVSLLVCSNEAFEISNEIYILISDTDDFVVLI